MANVGNAVCTANFVNSSLTKLLRITSIVVIDASISPSTLSLLMGLTACQILLTNVFMHFSTI